MIEQPRGADEARPPPTGTSRVASALARSQTSFAFSILILLTTLVAGARACVLSEQARVLVSEQSQLDVSRLERLERDSRAIVASLEVIAADPQLRTRLLQELSEPRRNGEKAAPDPRMWPLASQAAPPATAVTDKWHFADDDTPYPSASAKKRELAQAPRTPRAPPKRRPPKPPQNVDGSREP